MYCFLCRKVSRETLVECVQAVLAGSLEKKRGFQETVELQISLKNYDPQKDKRFSGTVRYCFVGFRLTLAGLGQADWCITIRPAPRVFKSIGEMVLVAIVQF